MSSFQKNPEKPKSYHLSFQKIKTAKNSHINCMIDNRIAVTLMEHHNTTREWKLERKIENKVKGNLESEVFPVWSIY